MKYCRVHLCVPLELSKFSVGMLHFLIPRNCSRSRWCYYLSPFTQRMELTFQFTHAWTLMKTFRKLMCLNSFYPVSIKEPILEACVERHTGHEPARIHVDMYFSAQHLLKFKSPSPLWCFRFCSAVYSDVQNDALWAQWHLVWNQTTVSSSFMASLAPKNES